VILGYSMDPQTIHNIVRYKSFQIAVECTIKRPRFKKILSNFNFKTSFHIAAECTIKRSSSFSKFSQQFKLPKHRSKLRKNVPLRDLVFKIFSAVQTPQTSFQIVVECTIKRPRFKKFLGRSNFQKHRTNSVRKNAVSLIFNSSSDFI